jgi:hypothetical protein
LYFTSILQPKVYFEVSSLIILNECICSLQAYNVTGNRKLSCHSVVLVVSTDYRDLTARPFDHAVLSMVCISELFPY